MNTPPELSLFKPGTLFCKANLRIGWAITWKVLVFYGMLSVLRRVAEKLAPQLSVMLLIVFFALSLAFLHYLARWTASAFYSEKPVGFAWPFIWRHLVAQVFSLPVIFVLYWIMLVLILMVNRSLAQIVAPILILVSIALGNIPGNGWAFHRYLASQNASKEES